MATDPRAAVKLMGYLGEEQDGKRVLEGGRYPARYLAICSSLRRFAPKYMSNHQEVI